MNKSTIKALGVLLLALTACREETVLSTTSSEGSVQLTAERNDQIVLKSRTGDGTMTETLVAPVRWDGTSELFSGVVYRWDSYEEALAAYETRRPEKYTFLKEIADNRRDFGKFKARAETSLSYAPALNSSVWRIGNYLLAECSIEQPAPSQPTSITLFFGDRQDGFPRRAYRKSG